MNALTAPVGPQPDSDWQLDRVATFPNLRALAWSGETLYVSRGYELLKTKISSHLSTKVEWETVATFPAPWWRQITRLNRLSFRLVRDGFHALAVLPSGEIVAAVPGAIVTLRPGEKEFRVSCRIQRGTRPLHITVVPNGTVFWGEYFDNPTRDEVRIYASTDAGRTWQVAHTFPRGAIRHVHNIVYDRWADCLWVLTGDLGDECRILRASPELSRVEVVLRGNQQARAVALVPTESGLYFSSDTPLEANHIYHLDRAGKLSNLAPISSSSIYGGGVGASTFFSTMVEPSQQNSDRNVRLYGSRNGRDWRCLLSWPKDRWPSRLFQYGNAILPDGINNSPCLAVSTVAVESEDLQMSLYAIPA